MLITCSIEAMSTVDNDYFKRMLLCESLAYSKIQNNITITQEKIFSFLFWDLSDWSLHHFKLCFNKQGKNNDYREGGGGTNGYIPKHTKLGRVKR